MMKITLEKLVHREDLSQSEMEDVIELIATGQLDPIQIGAFLVLLASKGETVHEITGLVEVFRRHAIQVKLPYPVLDIVGTGGDGHNTVNISTSATFVAAACGAKVAKHGNRSVSSKSGSSDVLEKLGVALLGPGEIKQCIDESNLAFMFAPNFHPALKYVTPIRKALQIRTVFNIMGPLLNPAGANHLMLGVYTPALLDTYAQVLCSVGVDHAIVVHCCGLDELAPVGVAEAVEIKRQPDGSLRSERITIDPQALGLPKCDIKDLEGGDAEENAAIIRNVLAGKSGYDHIVNTIAMNAGVALYVYGIADSFATGIELARNKIKSGEVLEQLDRFAKVSTRLACDNKTL